MVSFPGTWAETKRCHSSSKVLKNLETPNVPKEVGEVLWAEKGNNKLTVIAGPENQGGSSVSVEP